MIQFIYKYIYQSKTLMGKNEEAIKQILHSGKFKTF